VHIDSVEQVVFYVVAAIAVLAALGVVFSQDITHAALYLVLTLMMTAGVFVLLSAEFLSLVQVLVYGGGIAILVLFAIMITRVRELRQPLDGPQKPFGVVAALAVAAVLVVMVVGTRWATPSPTRIQTVTTRTDGRTIDDTTRAIGHDLFNTFAVPFELASLVLLVALVGAIILARGEDEEAE
jgi:NADH-quinone oxidoreductase subunit J